MVSKGFACRVEATRIVEQLVLVCLYDDSNQVMLAVEFDDVQEFARLPNSR
jgi:hypothetical protein